MNFKKIAVVIVLSLVLLSTVNAIYADDDRDYNIIDAIVNLTIDANGLLHVTLLKVNLMESTGTFL